MRFQKNYATAQRRQYVRLDSVFPVMFRILKSDGQGFLSDWIQGFTSNISKGGICLEVNHLNPNLAEILKGPKTKLALNIEMPLANIVNAKAVVAWVKNDVNIPEKYFIGLSYETIDAVENNRLIRYARVKKFFVPLVLTAILILSIAFVINTYLNMELIKGNKAIVKELVAILQESTIAQQKIKDITREKSDLELKIETLNLRIKALDEEREKKREEANKIAQLSSQIEKLTEEKNLLQDTLIKLQHKESSVTEELLQLDKKKTTLEKANIDKMYHWLLVHQNPRTGLVMSFEGDANIKDWAFIYDESLVIQVYTIFADYERVKKILNFFDRKAKRSNDMFFNAYYVNDGSPAEFIVHSGPNIWLGIAIMQYTIKSNDLSYVKLSEDIARAIMSLQNKDADGGLRGGPDIDWYSTEHNLDAYAFFNMLYEVTGKKQYSDARDKILNWLLTHTYDKQDVPIKRGKGDATIATDTYAWSIAAIGPQKLEELGMNPDRIMEFAEQSCAVSVSYKRPEGQTIQVRGFDFAPQRHISRGGVVSSEWTAQMIVAFKIMSDYYLKKDMAAKARDYEIKAEEYLLELGKMVISSPSPSGQGESCLPYATGDFVDTGHGWTTPKGSSTGSVAGTCYAIFAYYNYNPLQLKK